MVNVKRNCMAKKAFAFGVISLALAVGIALELTTPIALLRTLHQSSAKRPRDDIPNLEDLYVKFPLLFETNQGQTDTRVDYVSRGPGYALFLMPTEACLSLAMQGVHEKPDMLRIGMRLVGGNPHSTSEGLKPLPTKNHYFIGKDASKWHGNIITYAQIRYQEVYPGIDLLYYGNQRKLEYDFIVAPGADPNVIAIDFEGVDKLGINALGDLVFQTGTETILELHKPGVYQDYDGVRRHIACSYVLENRRVRFQVGPYDVSQSLVIDPVLVYSIRLAGSDGEAGYAIAVDAVGNVYLTGDTTSIDFPLAKPLQRKPGGDTDVFVTKLKADGSQLLYSTYIGGTSADVGYGIAVDSTGNVYITGDTRSTDFPLVKPLQSHIGGDVDVFVAKLSADGSQLLYSTYIGGENGERGNSIAVDASGNVYVTGYTNSTIFPTMNPLQGSFAGGNADAFVFKLNPNGSAFIYSTYLGGGNDRPDIGRGIATDSDGNAYVTGFTNSRDFPTVNPLQPFRGPTDAFVTKLNPTGSKMIYSTYLGGTADDEAMGIAVDASGNAYVTGHTESPNFPTTAGAFSKSCVAIPADIPIGDICLGGDAFVSKISPDGSALVYSTYLNGSGFEVGRSIAVDATGSAYVTGFTSSSDFTVVNSLQKTFGGGDFDAFVIKLNPSGSALTYSTFLGGSGEDGAYGIAVDRAGNAYVTGFTESRDFPTRGSLKRTSSTPIRGFRHVFVTKIADQGIAPKDATK